MPRIEDEEKSRTENQDETKGMSRRQFLRDAGLVFGGAAVAAVPLMNACSNSKGTTTTAPPVTTVVTSPPITKMVEVAPTGQIHLIVNGEDNYAVVPDNWSLLYVLREKLGYVGTKRGCERGSCGLCTVIMDGRPVLACLVLAREADGKQLTTVEGLVGVNGNLHPIKQAFIDNNATQCGFCVGGQMMMTIALLDFNPKPTTDQIKFGLAGTLCKCGAHPRIVAAVLQASGT
jgi:aerobic-type carbon monoxide dehydrogenase small subunit (CoxS/CutS family)